MALLSQEQIDVALADRIPAWRQEGDEIARDVTTRTFLDAIALVRSVGQAAEIAEHHPDIDIRYNKLRFALSTHSEGGLTDADLTMAVEIDDLIAQAAEQSGSPMS